MHALIADVTPHHTVLYYFIYAFWILRIILGAISISNTVTSSEPNDIGTRSGY